MYNTDNCIGRVVLSKAGRDSGRFFIVIKILDDNYVLVSDGKYRILENPKKKKLKHLFFTKCIAEDIKSLLKANGAVTNSMIKSFLESYDRNKED